MMRFPALLLAVVLVALREAACEQCACATTNVHVRDGVGTNHAILNQLLAHHCLHFKGHHRADSHGANWANVDFKGNDGWVHESYVTITTMTSCSGTTSGGGSTGGGTVHHTTSALQLPGCPQIVTRAEWHARTARSITKLTQTPSYMIIHHGASGGCHTKAECIHSAQNYQNWHMDGHGYSDIEYSFLVGDDGNVYEGRGWDRVGAHTKNYNHNGLAICFIGNFMTHPPSTAALNAAKQLINCAHSNHKITSTYRLRGHRDVGSTLCPGDKLYNIIQHWPHYH